MSKLRVRSGTKRFLVARISTGEHFRCGGRSLDLAEKKAAAKWDVSQAQVMGYDTRDLELVEPGPPPPMIASPERLSSALLARLAPEGAEARLVGERSGIAGGVVAEMSAGQSAMSAGHGHHSRTSALSHSREGERWIPRGRE